MYCKLDFIFSYFHYFNIVLTKKCSWQRSLTGQEMWTVRQSNKQDYPDHLNHFIWRWNQKWAHDVLVIIHQCALDISEKKTSPRLSLFVKICVYVYPCLCFCFTSVVQIVKPDSDFELNACAATCQACNSFEWLKPFCYAGFRQSVESPECSRDATALGSLKYTPT